MPCPPSTLTISGSGGGGEGGSDRDAGAENVKKEETGSRCECNGGSDDGTGVVKKEEGTKNRLNAERVVSRPSLKPLSGHFGEYPAPL